MKKLVQLVLIVLAQAFCLSIPAQANELTGTLKKIKDTNTITLGHRDTSVPLSYLDGDQKPVGYSVDICLEIVKEVRSRLNLPNLQVKYVPITSQTRIPLITNGTVDADCGSTTNTVERQKQVSFLYTHFVTGIKLLAKKKDSIKSYKDLKAKTLVTVNGTTSERLFKDLGAKENLDLTFIGSADMAEAFMMVETGRATAWPIDESILFPLIALSKRPADFEVVGEFLSYEPIAVMVRKDDPQFKALGDSVLKSIFQSGKINEIYNKWFAAPIPPKGITLQLPLSDSMKKLISNPDDKGI